MWIILAVITFILGQVYLFRCLGKLDRFLEKPQMAEPRKEILSIAFSDPTTADHITQLLESFSLYYPEIDIVLLTGQNVLDAVYDGRASLGFLPAEHHVYSGLNCLPITMKTNPVLLGNTGMEIIPIERMLTQEIVWKRNAFSSPADTFARYLRDRGVVDSRNAG